MAVFRWLQQTRGGETLGNGSGGGNQRNTHFSAYLHSHRLTGRSFVDMMGSGEDDAKWSGMVWKCVSLILAHLSRKSDSLDGRW